MRRGKKLLLFTYEQRPQIVFLFLVNITLTLLIGCIFFQARTS